MSSRLIRDGILVSIVGLGGFFIMTQREMIYEFIGVQPSDIVEARANRLSKNAAPVPDAPKAMIVSGSATSINKSPDGHFWIEARVNASTVKFLVDTGASVVALTPLDAQKAGIKLQNLNYTAPIDTASGRVYAAPVTLSIVSVGNVSVRDVRAVVISEGLPHSLLGMSYLGELQSVEASRGMLILRQ